MIHHARICQSGKEATDQTALALLYENLLSLARQHHAVTGRHLHIYGELAELYGAVAWGIRRHRINACGSDGRLGNAHVEIKCISPLSTTERVTIKMTGNFSHLLLVRIFPEFRIDSRLIPRKSLPGTSKVQRHLTWNTVTGSPALAAAQPLS